MKVMLDEAVCFCPRSTMQYVDAWLRDQKIWLGKVKTPIGSFVWWKDEVGYSILPPSRIIWNGSRDQFRIVLANSLCLAFKEARKETCDERFINIDT